MVQNMDLALITTVLLAASSCALNPSLDVDWKNWRSHHGKHYPQGAEAFRREIWENNLERIARHNEEHALGKHSFSLKINHFGDLLDKEFEQLMNGVLTEPSHHYEEVPVFERSGSFEAPKEVNWGAKGFVTPVKNQAQFLPCYKQYYFDDNRREHKAGIRAY